MAQGQWPMGTVTLVLGDIESSTEQWEASRDAMSAAMEAFVASLDQLVDQYGGVREREQGEGDNFVVAFASSSDALRFAVALQRGSQAGTIAVRTGIHTGEVVTHADGSHGGTTIIRAARLRDVGHGGQVLLSNATATLAADHLDADSALLDLGEHRLKGLSRPERIWQLCHPDLRPTFPALRVVDANPTNLPPRFARFVGRDEELAHVRSLLAEPGCVTITGAGGSGKTRLGLELLAELDPTSTSRWFVDLATVNDQQGVVAGVTDAVGVRPSGARSPTESIAASIGARRAVIVLDNCEHLVPACAELTTDLLARCPRLTVLATSREPLGVGGEITYRLPSLQPAHAHELFAERARRADPTFSLDAATVPIVDAICERLDGMPLAIELAAARLRVFSPQQLLDALHDRFRLLTGGARTALPRQRTLEASVDWSHALLLDAERTLLRRLSVFAGAFSLDAASAVASSDDLAAHHVFDLLAQLVDKSLVVPDGQDRNRFRLLETIRHYAAAKLVDAGEADSSRARHYRWFLDRARGGETGWSDEDDYRRAVIEDEVNLRRALQWAAEQDDAELLLRLVEALFMYWVASRRASEGAAWFTIVIDGLPPDRLSWRARLLGQRSRLRALAGDVGGAVVDADESIAMARELGDDRLLLQCLLTDSDLGREGDEALQLAIAMGDRRSRAFALQAVGFHQMRSHGDTPNGLARLRESAALAAELGLTSLRARSHAFIAMGEAMYGAAGPSVVPELAAAAAGLRELGEGFVLMNVLGVTAMMRVLVGDHDGAQRDLDELDALADEIGDATSIVMRSLGHGLHAFARGDHACTIDQLSWLDATAHDDAGTVQLVGILAIAEALDGRHDDAERHVQRALASGISVGGLVEASAAIVRCVNLLERGAPEVALDVALEAALHPNASQTGMAGLLLDVLARTSSALGHHDEAARLVGAAREMADQRAALGAGTGRESGGWTSLLDGTEAAIRAERGDDDYDRLVEQGRGLTWDEAIALLRRGRGPRQRAVIGWSSLTPTEADVARLVATGLSNKDVADRLFITVATVKTHLTHVYAKVGVRSRAQLAAQAHRLPTPG